MVFMLSIEPNLIGLDSPLIQSIDLEGETLSIDNNLLFQRRSVIAEREHVSIQTSLEYELCSFPVSLFDKTGLMRDSCKSNLADAIWKVSSTSNATFPKNKIFVLDGCCALIQKRTWQKGLKHLKTFIKNMLIILFKTLDNLQGQFSMDITQSQQRRILHI